MKTVYLHIGNFKTGTSAIQKYCSDNREELLKAGCCYPLSGRPHGQVTGNSHSALSLSLLQELGVGVPLWYRHGASFSQVAHGLLEELNTTSVNTALISSEEFYRFATLKAEHEDATKRQLQALFQSFEVKAVMYVREPLDFAKSWYNEVNKSSLPIGRFSDFLFNLPLGYIDPRINAGFWRQLFGHESLILRRYDPQSTRHIEGLLETLGLNADRLPPASKERVHKKRDENTLERDRLAKIHAIKSEKERNWWLKRNSLGSAEGMSTFQQKLEFISQGYETFCETEGIDPSESKLTLEAVLQHQKQVNPDNVMPPSKLQTQVQKVRSRLRRKLKR